MKPLVLHIFFPNTFLVCINMVIVMKSNIFFWHYWSSVPLAQYLTHSVHWLNKLCVKHLQKGVDEHIYTSNMQRYLSPQKWLYIYQHRG